MPLRLDEERLGGYQIPSLASMLGQMIPHEIMAPISNETLTIIGHNIPTPTYVEEKSK